MILIDIVCCVTKSCQPLPIQFDATSEEGFREIIGQIQDTGVVIVVIVVDITW